MNFFEFMRSIVEQTAENLFEAQSEVFDSQEDPAEDSDEG